MLGGLLFTSVPVPEPSALAQNLRGRIALQRNDGASARQAFEAALTKDLGCVEATGSLAALDVADSRNDAASARFEAVVKQEPNHAQYRLTLARPQLQAGNKTAACVELDKLATLGRPFIGRVEVGNLLKQLGG